MQAGVSATRPHAISPAIGYNQLLSTNSVSILAESGTRLLAALRQKAKATTGDARFAMERKIEALKRMIVFSRSVPNSWNEHDQLAKTTAVGSVVGQIARIKGARAVGIAGGPDKCR